MKRLIIVYEYVEGETLQEVVEKHGAQSEENAILWARNIAYALQYIHGLNPPIFYSDLNPRKIFLLPAGQIKLVGLDDISSSEMWKQHSSFDLEIYMTPGYYAPEGFARNANEKSDIYSLGVIMYFLVTGISPEERYQNCEELLYDLEGRTGPSNFPTFWKSIRQKEFWKMVFRK